MKKILILISTLVVFVLIPIISIATPIEERDLPHESGPPPKPGELPPELSITFVGYVNSRDVTVIGGVMSVVYYFCNNESDESVGEFCSNEEGILIVSGADTGKIPSILKDLDNAINLQKRIAVRLSETDYISGIRKIIDVKILN